MERMDQAPVVEVDEGERGEVRLGRRMQNCHPAHRIQVPEALKNFIKKITLKPEYPGRSS
jgi:hypothetical protein